MAAANNDLGGALKTLEQTLNLYLGQKAPALPVNVKNLIVKLLPWLIIFFFIVTLLGFLAIFGVSIFTIPFISPAPIQGVTFGLFGLVMAIFLGVSLLLEGLAIQGLFKQLLKAWYLIYYLTLINAVVSILALLGGNIGSILVSALSLYILFQIKSYYK